MSQNAFAALDTSDEEEEVQQNALSIDSVHSLVTRQLITQHFAPFGMVSIERHRRHEVGLRPATVTFGNASQAAAAQAALQGTRLHPTLEPMRLAVGTPMQAWLRAKSGESITTRQRGD